MIDRERRFNTRRGENTGYQPKTTRWEKFSVAVAVVFFVSWLISRFP